MLGRPSSGLPFDLFLDLSFRRERHDSAAIGSFLPFERRNDGLQIVAVLSSDRRPVGPDLFNNRS